MTRRQQKVWQYIQQQLQQQVSPSLREVARAVGLSSVSTVYVHVQALIREGLLAKDSQGRLQFGSAAQQPNNAEETTLPLLGEISAGCPLLAQQQEEPERVNLRQLLGPEHYVLRINGDSMIDDGIVDGALVVIRPTRQIRDGQLVVALVDNTVTTLKRLYREKDGKIRLQPANNDYLPQFYEPERVAIQGSVVGVVSHYQG